MINWEGIYNKHIKLCKDQKLNDGTPYFKHHILPKHQKGGNEKDNIVLVTLKQHILCHYILWKCYKNQGDYVAWLMMTGQTSKGLEEKKKLAVEQANKSNRNEKIKEIFSNPEKVRIIVNKRKETLLKNNKDNNGGFYTNETRKKLKYNWLNKHKNVSSKEASLKKSESLKRKIKNMTKKEFDERYRKPMLGEKHPMYGNKRPGNKAGNYGTSKGKYILIDPFNKIIEFYNLKEILNYGINESVIRRWANKGKIINLKNFKTFKWTKYEIKFILNENYGIP